MAMDLVEQVTDFEKALLSLDRLAAQNILVRPPDGTSILDYLDNIVVPALEEIGRKWSSGQVALAQVYMSGRICEELVNQLLPAESPDRRNQPRLALVVLEDYHLLGKRMLYAILRASGYNLLDYKRMDVDELVERTLQDRIEVLLISVLMLPSALRVKVLVEKLAQAGAGVKVIVGGAPFRLDDQLWREVGADAMCRTASEAVTTIFRIWEGVR